MRRKEERSKQGQTNNKAKQHSIPKAVTYNIHVHVALPCCLFDLASLYIYSGRCALL